MGFLCLLVEPGTHCSWFCVSSRYCYLQSFPLAFSMAAVFFLTCPGQYSSEDFKYSRSVSSLCSSILPYNFGELQQPCSPAPSPQIRETINLPQNFLQAVTLGKHRTRLLISHLSGIPVLGCIRFNIFRTIVYVQVFNCFTSKAKFGTCYFILIRGRSLLDDPLII